MFEELAGKCLTVIEKTDTEILERRGRVEKTVHGTAETGSSKGARSPGTL